LVISDKAILSLKFYEAEKNVFRGKGITIS
jgi:hypothetical protein